MKAVKMSLVAVMAMGASAFAVDNVKLNGEAKLWYNTTEYSGTGASTAEKAKDFFDHDTNTMAHVRLTVGGTADLLQNLSAGLKVSALTTLGIENNLVGAVPTAKYDASGNLAAGQLNDQSWVEEGYLAYTAGKTTAKVGRQALSTPLAFSEDWNVVSNTFEAAVLLNNDLPDTTLVGAWVGKHNGVGLLQPTAGRGTTMAYSGDFSTFGKSGAYAAAAINKSLPDTTLQAWYYNVMDIADAFWLQADAKVAGMVSLGAQYANMNPKNLGTAATDNRTSDMYAVKAAVDIADFNVYAAYSSVSTGTLGFANVATGDKTSMYTGLASVYMDGEIVSAPDTKAWKVGASTKIIPGVALSASYAKAEVGNNEGTSGLIQGAATRNADFTAWDIIAKTKAGPVDLTAIYTQFEKDWTGTSADKTTDTFRVIASLKF